MAQHLQLAAFTGLHIHLCVCGGGGGGDEGRRQSLGHCADKATAWGEMQHTEMHLPAGRDTKHREMHPRAHLSSAPHCCFNLVSMTA